MQELTTNRKFQLVMFIIVILLIGGFIGSVITKAAMKQALDDAIDEAVDSMDERIEIAVKKKLKEKRQKTSQKEEKELIYQDLFRSVSKLNSVKTVSSTLTPMVSPTQRPMESVTPMASPTMRPTESPTQKSTESPTGTPEILATQKPTESPTPTLKVVPTMKPTESPIPTLMVLPTMRPLELPIKTPTVLPTIEPTISPTRGPTSPVQTGIDVKVTADVTIMYSDIEETSVVQKLKIDDKLINVVEVDYGWLKATHDGKEGYVYYKDTNYLNRKKIFSPVDVTYVNEAKATVYKATELRTKPGCTSQSEVLDILESGENVVIHTIEEMLQNEDGGGYCKVTVCRTNQEGYVSNDCLDWDMTIEFEGQEEKEVVNTGETSTETSTEVLSEKGGVTIEVINPMKIYRGNYVKSGVICNLERGEQLTNVQECTESDSGWLMATYKSGNKVIKGFVQYLNTNYLDKRKVDTSYTKELEGIKATVNANGVNLRNSPGITSKVVKVADKGLELSLISYEEVVRNEKYGWYKATVPNTKQVVYIYGKYVDVKKNIEKNKEKVKDTDEKEATVVTATAIAANKEVENIKPIFCNSNFWYFNFSQKK